MGRFGDDSTLVVDEVLSNKPVSSGFSSTAFAFCRRVDIIEWNGVDWLLFDVPLEEEERSVREEEERDMARLRIGVMMPGVESIVGLVPSDAGIDGVNDVKSDPVSFSAVNSISPSAGISFASANGILSSSSSSLASLSSSLGLEIAYTPRRVRRSLMFKTGLSRSDSLGEGVSESESESEFESELESELRSAASSACSGEYPPLPFFSHVSHKQWRFFFPTADD